MTTLLVAQAGGHLTELQLLAQSVEPDESQRVWVTFAGHQIANFPPNSRVELIPSIGTRDLWGVIRGLPRAWKLVRTIRPSRVVSTGAAVALAYLPLARLLGSRCIYIESATRVRRPSVTGRLLSLVPGVERVAQGVPWRGWRQGPSVLDGFPRMPSELPNTPAPRVLVLMGTLGFDFSRLAYEVERKLPPDAVVTWQLGSTQMRPSRGDIHETIDARQVSDLARQSDIVIAHAGVGSALTALGAGIWPIVVPRRAHNGEHIDDHQAELALELGRRGLAHTVEADALSPEILRASHRFEVIDG